MCLRGRRRAGSGAYLPRGQRAAGAGEVVARRAVGPEQLAALGDVARPRRRSYCASSGWPGRRRARRRTPRAASISLVRVDDLLAARTWAPGLGQRHPAGADLEVDRGGADADQARAVPALDALAVGAVAGGAADEEQLLALGRRRRRWRRRRPAPGARGRTTAYSPPVSQPAPSEQDERPRASGWRRRAAERRHGVAGVMESSRRCSGASGGRGRRHLMQVDRGEQADPHDVDEVPVVRHDDGAGRLLVGEPPGHEGAAEDEQEGDQAAGHVQAVEAGGQVEHRAVRVGRRS